MTQKETKLNQNIAWLLLLRWNLIQYELDKYTIAKQEKSDVVDHRNPKDDTCNNASLQ